jgi:hypothetical protein
MVMANVSRINGFSVVKHLSGGSATGQVNVYYVSSAGDEILKGDIVKLAGSSDANGIASVDLCGATDVPVGVVVGILNPKISPVGKMSTGSITLDLPAVNQIAASASGYVLVADDPNVVLEVEASNGTPVVTDVGLNASHANGSRTSSTITSPAYLDFGTEATTSTLNFQILGFVQRSGNEVGASAKLLVRFNVHQYKSVGTTGI